MRPGTFPNHGAAGDYWEAAEDKEDETDVGDAGGEIACYEDEDEDNGAKGELEENRLEG